MKIGIPREAGEPRVAIVPSNLSRLVKMGMEIEIESGLGTECGYRDEDFTEEGARVVKDRQVLVGAADWVMRVRKPPIEEVGWMKQGSVHASFLDPFHERELVRKLAAQGVSAFCMEMIPRITRAQKMDALSSQANLGGYVAVVLAAAHSRKIFPMMMTAAGTVSPARVLVIGAGVAGLQAIATAKRLGARVEAYDTRPVVEEQVRSLGAKFLKIDLGETGQTKEGYAKALTDAQLERQRAAMKRFCSYADVVVTTAQVFGRRAPVLVTAEMVRAMPPGSVVVDMAIESGGNVEGGVLDQITEIQGVKIIGYGNLPGRVPVHASQVYSTNLLHLIESVWDKENKTVAFDLEDEIVRGALVTHQGRVIHEPLRQAYEANNSTEQTE